MYIEYELDESERQAVKIYMKRTFVKQLLVLNKHKYNPEKSRKNFAMQMAISIAVFLLALTAIHFIYIPFTVSTALTYVLSIFIAVAIFNTIKSLVLGKLVLIHEVALQKIYRLRRRIMLSIDVYRYVIKIERMLRKCHEFRMSVDNDIGQLAYSGGKIQTFHRHTVSRCDVFQGVSFYSFIDSATHKRCIFPVPCRYQKQFLSALM